MYYYETQHIVLSYISRRYERGYGIAGSKALAKPTI